MSASTRDSVNLKRVYTTGRKRRRPRKKAKKANRALRFNR